MNTKLILLALALCVAMTGLAIAEPVTTTDFQGDVTVQKVGDTTKETRTGKWQYEGSGVLEGEAVIRVAGSDYTLNKQGKLTTVSFQGDLVLDESVEGANTFRKEVFTGRELLTSGAVFEGKAIKEAQIKGDYKKTRLVQRGKLNSAVFQGELSLDETVDPRSSVRKEVLTGTWRVSPDLTLEGQMITTTKNGVVTVTDKRKKVKLSPGDLSTAGIQAVSAELVIKPGEMAVEVNAAVVNPVITGISPVIATWKDTVNIVGSGFGPAHISSVLEISIIEGQWAQWSPTEYGGTWTANNITLTLRGFSDISDRDMKFRVSVYQPGGGPNLLSNIMTIQLRNPPILSTLAPYYGPAGCGQIMNGKLFKNSRGNGKVKFDTTEANILDWQDTVIVCNVPSLAPNRYPVRVITDNGVSDPLYFTVKADLPVITSLTRTSGPPGTQFIINGANFGMLKGLGTVSFGTIWNWNENQIFCSVPSVGDGPRSVKVITGAGTSNGITFTVNSNAKINSLTPLTGYLDQEIELGGENFGSSGPNSFLGISFGSMGVLIPSTQVLSWSESAIRFRMPSGTGPGPCSFFVKVNTVNSNSVSYTVIWPNITSLSARQGRIGNPIRIRGDKFGATKGASTVKFDSTPVAVLSWSNTDIYLAVPSLGYKDYSVTVTVGESTSNYKMFRIIR